MDGYRRVLPRDLFNEADLLKNMGRLWIGLDELGPDCRARIIEEDVSRFEIVQNEASGGITVANITFEIGGIVHGLERGLNARRPWPLMVETSDADPDFEPVNVFDEDGSFSANFRRLVGAG